MSCKKGMVVIMKKNTVYKIFAVTVVTSLAILSLTACGSDQSGSVKDTLNQEYAEDTLDRGDAATASGQSQGTDVVAENLLAVEEMFTDRDMRGDYDESESIAITLTGDSASCSASSVTVLGDTVTVTEEGIYILSGSLEGMIIVDAPDSAKVQL